MARTVKIENLAEAIAAELEAYSQEVTDGLKEEVRRVAKESADQLKRTSPRDSGEYAAGWRVRIAHESDEDIRVQVYNAKKPQLTHLLEKGHAKVGGGRVEGDPHIAPVELEAEKKLMNKAKVVIRGGA